VLLEGTPLAEPLFRALYKGILEAGGHPHLLVSLDGPTTFFSGLDEVFLEHASAEQLDHPPTFFDHAYKEFESRIRIHSAVNTRGLSKKDKQKMARRAKAVQSITADQFRRGETGEFKWMTTLFPTNAYAQDAEMSLAEFEDFVFHACHVDDPEQDAIAYWQSVDKEQERLVKTFEGHDQVRVTGPNCDLTFSIQGRSFINASGRNNMPDGEIFTGPVEESMTGRVRFTYPTADEGNVVDGVELVFDQGRVVEAHADKNQEFLDEKLATDEGARYVGEFAIGLNYGVERSTMNILFDEKIGGSFHMALGAGYPETGSVNKSAIHWDMITDMREESEIVLDGEVIYQNGHFTI
jgi:aminopeptidase